MSRAWRLALLLATVATAVALWLRGSGEIVRLASDAVPFNVSAPVDRVDDGDTLVATVPGRGRVRVRLHAVDAPELVQPFGAAARDGLGAILGARPVGLDCYKVDPRGRAVCRVTTLIDGQRVDVGRLLVERGLAWHYRAFASEQTAQEKRALLRAEQDARSARRGLWQAQAPMPPWTCRDRLRSAQPCD